MTSNFNIGVDLGGINIVSGLVDSSGNIIDKIVSATPKKSSECMDVICNHITKLSKQHKTNINSIGIGCPGSVDSSTGVIKYWSNLNFKNVSICKDIYNITGLKTLIENDATCACIGEYVARNGKYDPLIIVTLGTGVGGGAIINNKLYTGINNSALEIGHMSIDKDGAKCTCGRRGCFEMYASATALINKTRALMKEDKISLLWEFTDNNPDNLNGEIIFNAYNRDDKLSIKIIDDYIKDLGCGITNLINIFQPMLICIGGGIAGAGNILIDSLNKIIDKEDYARNNNMRTKIEIAKLGNDAGIIGAALLDKFRSNNG